LQKVLSNSQLYNKEIDIMRTETTARNLMARLRTFYASEGYAAEQVQKALEIADSFGRSWKWGALWDFVAEYLSSQVKQGRSIYTNMQGNG
jgi:hypothetical protein